ncbi:MAG: alpha/beta hydrolase [Halobacteriales archaeon]|nr:alpha/beta hydrolase [Halobacteriales archaeon]
MTVPIAEPGAWEKRVVGATVRAVFLRGRRGGPWPVPDGGQPLEIEGNVGASLAAVRFPHPSPRGIVVLAHPDRRYGKHWFVRQGWVSWLLANGFDALIFDFAAYGASRGGSTFFHDDVAAACAKARELRPGLPLHVIGLSIGAFACVNAAERLGAESMVLESPYASFDAWYDNAPNAAALRALNRTLARLWPRTYARIDAGANAGRATAQRILVAASPADTTTPMALSRAVSDRLPAGRTRWLEVPGREHLRLFEDDTYKAAILETLTGGRTPDGRGIVTSSRRAASLI